MSEPLNWGVMGNATIAKIGFRLGLVDVVEHFEFFPGKIVVGVFLVCKVETD